MIKGGLHLFLNLDSPTAKGALIQIKRATRLSHRGEYCEAAGAVAEVLTRFQQVWGLSWLRVVGYSSDHPWQSPTERIEECSNYHA
jgi:hypothetical protein